MKISQLLFAAALLLVPFFTQAQDHIGSWQWTTTGPDGSAMPIQVTFKADNTFEIDFGADGQVEENGEYSMNGNRMTIKVISDGSQCTNKVGVYDMSISGDTATATMVSDECDARRGDSKAGDSFSMSRAK